MLYDYERCIRHLFWGYSYGLGLGFKVKLGFRVMVIWLV